MAQQGSPPLSRSRTLRIHIRFDDECNNKHNSFSVTGDTYDRYDTWLSGGCLHDEIGAIPGFANLIKWHLCDGESGPMHGVANALYFAGARDYNGLLAGEFRPFPAGKDGKRYYELAMVEWTPEQVYNELMAHPGQYLPYVAIKHELRVADASELPPVPQMQWVLSGRYGEGKAREFDKARSAAVWPEATDEQLSLPREELKALLEARIPQLLVDFRAAVESIGFAWTPADVKEEEVAA